MHELLALQIYPCLQEEVSLLSYSENGPKDLPDLLHGQQDIAKEFPGQQFLLVSIKGVIDVKIKVTKQIVIFVVIAAIVATAVVALMVIDEKRARRKESEKAQQDFLRKIMEMQKEESETTLDEAREGMPDAEKVDFKP